MFEAGLAVVQIRHWIRVAAVDMLELYTGVRILLEHGQEAVP